MTMTIRENLDTRPMAPYQCMVVALCFLINMMDGFDVLVMAFVAAPVSTEWSLNGAELGYLLSAGLVGMAIGSLFVAPWADVVGRRPLIILSVSIAGTGMICSSFASSPEMLGVLRLFTGVGIGGILASSYVAAGEYSSKRWRGLSISLQSTAYALGATIGGTVAAHIIPDLGWRSVFLYGGIVTLATVPVMVMLFPESIDFLITRRPKNSLQRINRLAKKMGIPVLTKLPGVTQVSKENSLGSIRRLFSPALLRSTLLIWAAFFLVMFGFYFVMSWTPRLLVSAGLTTQQGITGGILLNIGGIFGTALVGLLAARFRLSKVLTAYMIITAVLLAVFIYSTGNVTIALGIVLLIGIFLNGCIAGVYALTPGIYGAAERVTGLGWGIGTGRVGAILSPLVAGVLIDTQWAPADLYQLYGAVFVLAALAIALLHKTHRNAIQPVLAESPAQGA
ncbi:MFS transporter [Marinobacterium rhizophilum]|uniref:MFS transporter n=1 Tax=Marinobacterium rhizophilum TaxID=420402 RepID=A0ABY5HK31_9GAMM|nr:MFS transporter [Marinobacterium rhizophilum]UTW12221.1 MFS transporter [Marinobacterium rhizophilum]